MIDKAMIVLTDNNWLSILSRLNITDEVNFWTPTPWKIRGLDSNAHVYFLSKKKQGRMICGYGEFVKCEEKSLIDSWNQYGIKNGVNNFVEMKKLVKEYLHKNTAYSFDDDNYIIGNIILKNVIFIDNEQQKGPESYGWDVPNQVVKNKYVTDIDFDLIYEKIITPFSLIDSDSMTYSKNKSKIREGQNEFRRLLMNAYSGMCCITGEEEKAILQAAHIQEYISKESNHIQNGLLMRMDFHRLFDLGYITIDKDFKICVSDEVNSSYYKSFKGKQIRLPKKKDRPSIDALDWHYKNVFKKYNKKK